jgi:transcriptional regulator with XRE-family HTH domain
VANQDKFFGALGARVRELRKKHGYSQEDMLSFGFSTRHWQQVEAGRPITVTTLLRICEVFATPMSKLVQGLDREGVYDPVDVEIPLRRKAGRKVVTVP